MMQHIKLLSLVMACIILNIAAMVPKSNELDSIRDIPEYCQAITTILQKHKVYNNKSNPNLDNHRVYALYRWDDCCITAILSQNINTLLKNAEKQYPLAITCFGYGPDYNYAKDKSVPFMINYGIKCPSDNQNFLTRRTCYRVIDQLQRSWYSTDANEYYTHLHKEYPADNPHENDMDKWLFFSKRSSNDFLQDEPSLIRFLASRLNMADKVDCRATMTNDLKRIASIHIWVLKEALQQFNYVFDFEFVKK